MKIREVDAEPFSAKAFLERSSSEIRGAGAGAVDGKECHFYTDNRLIKHGLLEHRNSNLDSTLSHEAQQRDNVTSLPVLFFPDGMRYCPTLEYYFHDLWSIRMLFI